MRTIILFFLTFFYTIIINSAELKMEAFGKSKTRVFNLTDGSIFLTYSSESVVTNNIGIRGVAECEGMLEISKGITSSNIMCKVTDEFGDKMFFQFKASSNTTDVATSGTQKFTVVDGDGRYKELIGFKGISATASIMPKDLGEGYYEDFYSWAGKGDLPDAVFERIKNYQVPEPE